MGIEVFRDCYGRVAQVCLHQLIVCTYRTEITRTAVFGGREMLFV
jgi:hypothetical protein